MHVTRHHEHFTFAFANRHAHPSMAATALPALLGYTTAGQLAEILVRHVPTTIADVLGRLHPTDPTPPFADFDFDACLLLLVLNGSRPTKQATATAQLIIAPSPTETRITVTLTTTGASP